MTTEAARAAALFERQGRARDAAARSTADQRIAMLRRLKAALKAAKPALAEAMRADFGKYPIETELTEIATVIDEINFVVRHLAEWMRPARVPAHPLLGGRAEIRFEPRGRVLVLAPWNYPVHLSLMPLVAAIAAGNVAMIRPSERAPQTRQAIVTLVAEAVPEDHAAVVEGDIADAEALLELPFDHFFFTGSRAVGAQVAAAARRHGAGVTLELGGKTPAIVESSADLPRTAARLAWGKCVNAGQTCIAPDYVLVPRSIVAPFCDAMREALTRMYGPAERWRHNPEYCRLVDDQAFTRLGGMLDAAIAGGARVEIGGDRDEATRYLAPTVLTGVPPDAALLTEEIFGPILPVVPYDRPEEAIAFARERGRPLALYVFARLPAAADAFIAGIPSGGVCVNHTLVHVANPSLPFGGVGESGFGRYHGRFGFLELSHQRAVQAHGRFSSVDALRPPYSRLAGRIGRVLYRWKIR